MKKIILGAIAAAAVTAPLALAVAPANAATPVNHGQCVSSAVKAGVTGDAFTAIAKNNSLVGAYGSTSCPAPVVAPPKDKADADVQWAYDNGNTHITGTTTFNVTASGGALVYTSTDDASHNQLFGTITPGSYHKVGNTATFSGTIDAGSSPNYLANPMGGNYFTVKIVDGTPDMIAVLANQVLPGTWITEATLGDALVATADYPMGVGTAGIVTAGDLTLF